MGTHHTTLSKMGNKVTVAKEAQDRFDKEGLTGLKSYTEEKLNAWNEAEVKIAVTGQSGTGKSSLINRLRGLTPEDRKKPYYAKTGAGKETTSERREYEFPSSPLIKIYDLPGCGTPA